jgi:TolB-like protein/Tfp pilus assembly protein PilF
VSFLAELRRRNVFRMAALYFVSAWLIVQVAETLLPIFETPMWVRKTLVTLLAIGFVPTLVFAWLYELTPDGLKRDTGVTLDRSIAAQTGRRMDQLTIAVLLAVAALVAADRYWPRGEETSPGTLSGPNVASGAGSASPGNDSARVSPQKSIAVLAFADLSPGRDHEYFADGIAEEILNALTRVKDLKVAGRTSSFKFKGVNEDLRVIGEQLGVAHVLEGSVRKQGDRVRITAQLVKADDGFHLWSETYDRKLDDVFAIQDEISQAIADALSVQFMAGGTGRRDADTEAYDVYLRARQLLASRTASGIAQAASLFEAATIIDADFDGAWSGRAKALAILWLYGSVPDTIASNAKEAKRAAERALALNAANAEAYSMLAYLNGANFWNWDAALLGTRRATELAPNDAEVANFAGDVFRFLGDFDNAIRWEQRAVDLDPLLAVNHNDLGWTLYAARRCEAAVASYERALEIDPVFLNGLFGLALALDCLGEPTRVDEIIERLAAKELNAPPLLPIMLKVRRAIRDDKFDDARMQLAEMNRELGEEVLHYWNARFQSQLGEYDDAARSLERAYRLRDPNFCNDPDVYLPEDWPDHPAIRAALDKPELNSLFEIRRRNHASLEERLRNE